jgi:hypothetical protein
VRYLDPDAGPYVAAEHTGYAVDCDTCGEYGRPQPTSEAASQLAAIHDDMHHRGVPTATVCPA